MRRKNVIEDNVINKEHPRKIGIIEEKVAKATHRLNYKKASETFHK